METSTDLPIRLTICDTAQQATEIIKELQDHDFTLEEISVLCSRESYSKEFAEFVDESPGLEKTNDALNKSGWAALGLGAFAAATGLITAGGSAVMTIGVFYGLAITGTLASLFVSRGVEKELADYYDQAVTLGKILVAVEAEDPQRQIQAEEILAKSGNKTAALPKESATDSD